MKLSHTYRDLKGRHRVGQATGIGRRTPTEVVVR